MGPQGLVEGGSKKPNEGNLEGLVKLGTVWGNKEPKWGGRGRPVEVGIARGSKEPNWGNPGGLVELGTAGAAKSQIGETESGGNGAEGRSRHAWDTGQTGGAGSSGDASTFGSGWDALLLGWGGIKWEGCGD